MEFFNKLGDMASKTYKKTSEKTEKIAKETKIKMKMNENKSKITDLYKEIGKSIYQKHINNNEIQIEDNVNSYCNQIDELSNENEKYQEELFALKNKRLCQNCFTEIDLNSKYCSNCGFEQTEENLANTNKYTNSDTTNIKIEDNSQDNN